MKKVLKSCITMVIFFSFLKGEHKPYHPYPILFIHGYTSNAGTWGADWDKDTRTDSLLGEGTSTFKYFLNLMQPYILADTAKFIPPWDSVRYPNRDLLEVINFDYAVGSVDPDEAGLFDLVEFLYLLPGGLSYAVRDLVLRERVTFPSPYQSLEGWGSELRRRIKEVLREYYGDDWSSNPDAKVILIAHSMGGLSVRQAFSEEPALADHVAFVITTGTPHEGTYFMDPLIGDAFAFSITAWLPFEWLGEAGEWLWSRGGIWVFFGALVKGLGIAVSPGVLDLVSSIHLCKYTDAGRDLGTTSNFQGRINSWEEVEKSGGTDWRVIINRIGAFPGGGWSRINTWAGVITGIQVAVYLSPFAFNPAMAALKAGSYAMYLEWFNDSDFAVDERSQAFKWMELLKGVRKIFTWRTFHGDEPKDYPSILKALENKPRIDMVYMSFPASGRMDTVILGLKEIDTIVANLDSVSIFFKLKDVYFLAQTRLSVNINGVTAGNLKYPDDKGFDGRWCRIPPEIIRYLGAGYNTLTITARNTLGEQVSKTFKIWLVPPGWFVWNRFPLHREVFNPQVLSLNSDSFSLYIIKEGLSPEQLTIAWDSLYIIPAGFYQDTSGRFHFDTVEENIKGTFLSVA